MIVSLKYSRGTLVVDPLFKQMGIVHLGKESGESEEPYLFFLILAFY